MQQFLKTTIKQAGQLAKQYYQKGIKVSIKSEPSDVVTDADIAVENFLIKKIREKYPDHGIIAEESEEVNPDAEYLWVIDPIDGTRNFSRHIAVWCTMVGITKNGKPYIDLTPQNRTNF